MTPSDKKAQNEALQPYRLAATRLIRSEMTRKSIGYQELSELLAAKGVVITTDSLRARVTRSMATGLFLAICKCLDIDEIPLTGKYSTLQLKDEPNDR